MLKHNSQICQPFSRRLAATREGSAVVTESQGACSALPLRVAAERICVLRLAQVLWVCYTSVAKEVACHLRRTRRRIGRIKLLAACSCSAPLSLGSLAPFPTLGAGMTAAGWRRSNRLLIITPWQ